MALQCSCRSSGVMAGNVAQAYARRFLSEVSAGDDGSRLLRCRVCGAYWELHEDDDAGDEGARRVRLLRVRSAGAMEDWRMYDSDDGD